MTPNEISQLVCQSDKVVGAEHLSNQERTAFVCAVFNVDGFMMQDNYDLDAAVEVGDPIIIYASICLASLQLEYWHRMHIENHLDEDTYQTIYSVLENTRARLRWALSFNKYGVQAPPYPVSQ